MAHKIFDGLEVLPSNGGKVEFGATSNALRVTGEGSTDATNALLVQNTSSTELFKIEDDGKVGVGAYPGPSPTGLLHVYDTTAAKSVVIDNSWNSTGVKYGIDLNVTGVGGSVQTRAIDINLQASTGSQAYGIIMDSTTTATFNTGIRMSVQGAGLVNYGGVFVANNSTNGQDYGLVGVAGGTSIASSAVQAGVLAQLQGTATNGRAFWISEQSNTSGTAYATKVDSTSGVVSSASTHYGHHITMTRAADTNIGFYVDVAGALSEDTAFKTNRGDAVFNEAGGDYDFRVEGDTNINLLFIDASEDKIGIGTGTPNTILDVNGSFATRASTPALLTSNTNNWVIPEADFIRMNTNGNYNLTGIAGGVDGRRITIVNIAAANAIFLQNEDILSTAANRIILVGQPITIVPKGSVILIYDATTARWRVISSLQA